MRKSFFSAAVVLAACLWGGVATAQIDGAGAKPSENAAQATKAVKLDLKRFKLTWSDEFDGKTLDRSKWDVPVQIRQGSSRWVKDLVSVEDGVLKLGIRKTDDPKLRYDCAAVRTRKDYDVNQTMFAQRYGYFETRCKLPRNVGADYWAAFWLMAGSINDKVSDTREGTEIDIMESFTFCRDAQYNLAFHWNGYGKKHNAAGLKCGKHPQVLDGGFHRFGLYWDEKVYVAFLDGMEVGRTDLIGMGKGEEGKQKSQGTCQQPAYIKLSCEAAKWAGVTGGSWEKEMPESDEFIVDYVRVYEGTLP